MQSEIEKASILRMAMGAIEELVDYEVDKVLKNMLDVNTKATGKRKITVTLELTPKDERRRQFNVSAGAKSTLVPTNPVATTLCVIADRNGEMSVVEMTPDVPGQLSMDGGEQAQPKILRLPDPVKQAL